MIAVCVPTWRPELYKNTFRKAWDDLFKKHDVYLFTTIDSPKTEGIKLVCEYRGEKTTDSIKSIMGKDMDLVYPRNAGTKLVAFYHIAEHMVDVDTIICLDDDVKPIGDPIQEHLDILKRFVPISWMPIASMYTRGVPYGVRNEAEVVLSHGVWDGVPDIDAPTQLIIGSKPYVEYRKMIIPKGVLYPMSEMNIAFKRKMLPYMYFAPTTQGVYGADDIWCGIESKRVIDEKGWAVATGYSHVYHERASDVFKILEKQGKFIRWNEEYWKSPPKDPYFTLYKKNRKRWEEKITYFLTRYADNNL